MFQAWSLCCLFLADFAGSGVHWRITRHECYQLTDSWCCLRSIMRLPSLRSRAILAWKVNCCWTIITDATANALLRVDYSFSDSWIVVVLWLQSRATQPSSQNCLHHWCRPEMKQYCLLVVMEYFRRRQHWVIACAGPRPGTLIASWYSVITIEVAVCHYHQYLGSTFWNLNICTNLVPLMDFLFNYSINLNRIS